MQVLTIPKDEHFLRLPTIGVSYEEIRDSQSLISEMIKTMYEYKGIGLAANQIGIRKQLFIISKSITKEPLDLIVFNPHFFPSNTKTKKRNEGCLSIPNKRINLRRYEKGTLTGQNRYGVIVAIDVTGYLAQVVQHEIDHLEGILIIDKKKENSSLVQQ